MDRAAILRRHSPTTHLEAKVSVETQRLCAGQDSGLLGLRVGLVSRQLCSNAGLSLGQSEFRAQWVRGKMTNLLDQMLAASLCSASKWPQGTFVRQGPFIPNVLTILPGLWHLDSSFHPCGAREVDDFALIFWSRCGGGAGLTSMSYDPRGSPVSPVAGCISLCLNDRICLKSEQVVCFCHPLQMTFQHLAPVLTLQTMGSQL